MSTKAAIETEPVRQKAEKRIQEVETVTIRFAGDSGDGIQLTGTQFTNTTAIFGNDISTMPDFPAEIRAPAGSLPGVSGFQINFSSHDIRTPGDEPNALVAMNPAALKTNLSDLEEGGILLLNEDAFTKQNLQKAGYEKNPLEDGSLAGYRLLKVPITSLTLNAVKESPLPVRQKERAKNMFALGLIFWLYDRPLEPTLKWIKQKFAKNPEVLEANSAALRAGNHYADTVEMFTVHYRVKKAKIEPGVYRKITGNEATAMGFVAASELAGIPLVCASYPITPASSILEELSRRRNFAVKTIQAEDEIASMGATIGAAFGGQIAITATSGPGLALKMEAIGLAVMTELPVVIVNVQRGGPSTGLPTKSEQSDLLQAMYGRNGECPVVVVAPATPADCFDMAIESVRIAIKYMTPVLYLSDGYLANGAEPWKLPAVEDLPKIEVKFRTETKEFYPYDRNPETLARPWAVPGTPGLEHRIGGLEKANITGNVNYDPDNHDAMVRLRAEKIAGIANDIPELEVDGDPKGKLLVVGWGSTQGAIKSAVEEVRKKEKSVSAIHLKYLNPFPRNLEEILGRFDKVLMPELNLGQLSMLIRSRFLIDTIGYNKVRGKPFRISELIQAIEELV